MKNIFFLLLTLALFSCNDTQTINHQETTSKVTYQMLKSIKENKSEDFRSLISNDLLNTVSRGQFDNIFKQYKEVVDEFDIPAYEEWVKLRIVYKFDSIKKVVDVGLPMIKSTTGGLTKYLFTLHFDKNDKISKFDLNRPTSSEMMPNLVFPPKENIFYFTLENLKGIRLYYLPGINSPRDSARHLDIDVRTITPTAKTEFEQFLNSLNYSKIVNARKSEVEDITNTVNLRAAFFQYVDGNKKLTLSVINSGDKPKYLEISTYYLMNAVLKYELEDEDQQRISQKLVDLIDKQLLKR